MPTNTQTHTHLTNGCSPAWRMREMVDKNSTKYKLSCRCRQICWHVCVTHSSIVYLSTDLHSASRRILHHLWITYVSPSHVASLIQAYRNIVATARRRANVLYTVQDTSALLKTVSSAFWIKCQEYTVRFDRWTRKTTIYYIVHVR